MKPYSAILPLLFGIAFVQCAKKRNKGSESDSSVEVCFEDTQRSRNATATAAEVENYEPWSDTSCCEPCAILADGSMACDCGEDDKCQLRLTAWLQKNDPKRWKKKRCKKGGDAVDKHRGRKPGPGGGRGGGSSMTVKGKKTRKRRQVLGLHSKGERILNFLGLGMPSATTTTAPPPPTNSTTMAARGGRALPLAPAAPIILSGGIAISQQVFKQLAPHLASNTISSLIGSTIATYAPTFLGGTTTTEPPPVQLNEGILSQLMGFWSSLSNTEQQSYLSANKKTKKPKKPRKPTKKPGRKSG